MKRLFLVSTVVLLSGCILQQKGPDPKGSAATAKLSGIVAFDEVRVGDRLQALVIARFEKPAPAKASERASVEMVDRATQDSPCKKALVKVDTGAPTAKKEAPKYLTVGKVGFGQALSDNFTMLDPDTASTYKATLNAEIPAGVYQIRVAQGSENEAFAGVFAIPEAFLDSQLGGTKLTHAVSKITRSAGVDLQWTTPAVPNDQNVVLLDLITDDGAQKQELHCVLEEKSLQTVGNTVKWHLDPSWVSDLMPTSKTADGVKGRIYLSRALLMRPKIQNVELRAQALRTVAAPIDIE